MDMIKRLIRDVFGFSGREINGFLILLPLSVFLVSIAPIYSSWLASRDEGMIDNARYLDSLVAVLNTGKKSVRDSIVAPLKPNRKANFFKFDPNTATLTTLERLGFPKHLSTRIASYRTAGGEFRVKSDLLKIYGIDSSFYKQLYPFIELPEKIVLNETSRKTTTTKNENVTHDLNTADSVQLTTVRGIGPKLAARIIKFRNSLGGFIKHDQLNEVYGLDSIVVRELSKAFFIQQNFEPVKLNVNSATEAELASHPYIRKKIAKAIITYRFQHTSFSSVDQIRTLSLLTGEEVERLLPYLKIND